MGKKSLMKEKITEKNYLFGLIFFYFLQNI